MFYLYIAWHLDGTELGDRYRDECAWMETISGLLETTDWWYL
jgi:hypothetical protein